MVGYWYRCTHSGDDWLFVLFVIICIKIVNYLTQLWYNWWLTVNSEWELFSFTGGQLSILVVCQLKYANFMFVSQSLPALCENFVVLSFPWVESVLPVSIFVSWHPVSTFLYTILISILCSEPNYILILERFIPVYHDCVQCSLFHSSGLLAVIEFLISLSLDVLVQWFILSNLHQINL